MRENFKVGDKVRTRGDIGNIDLIITKIHNNHYCTCKLIFMGIKYGKKLHFNMRYFRQGDPF